MSIVPLISQYIKREQDLEDRAKFSGLLDQFPAQAQGQPAQPALGPGGAADQTQVPFVPQQQGTVQAGGLLQDRPHEFYMRAAAIPGYEQMALQAQQGGQAMQRQMQGQDWSAQNMTMAQSVQAKASAAQQKWANDRQEFEYTNMSAAQRASHSLQQGQLAVAQRNATTNENQLTQATQLAQNKQNRDQLEMQYPGLALRGESAIKARGEIAKLDRGAEVSVDVMDYLANVDMGGKALDRGSVNAMQADYKTNMVPVFQQLFQAGALQAADLQLIDSVMGDPGAWKSLDANQKLKVGTALQTVEKMRGGAYGQFGQMPPPTQRGRSSWSRASSSRNVDRGDYNVLQLGTP